MEIRIGSLVPAINPNVDIVKTKDMGVLCIQKKYDYRIKINQNTFEIISSIDGKKTIEQLTSEFNRKSHRDVSTDAIFELLNGNLKKAGIVNMGDGYKIVHSSPSYLRLRINLISNKYSSYVSRYLKYLFGKSFFWPFFIIQNILVFSLFVMYAKDMYFQLENINIFDAIIVFFLMGFALLAHEFGHVSACDRFGAHYGSIGLGFYLFVPVMYADVSDIWRLPKKQRIIVNLAGVYMGNIVAIISFFIYLYTQNLVFLYVFSLQSLEGISNLNPLLKYDGYWLLSDWLDLPNMSKLALEKVKSFSFSLLATYQAKDWFLLVYGLLSPIFIISFLMAVLIFNPDSLLYFPIDFSQFIYHSVTNINSINFQKMANYVPSFLFYYLAARIGKKYFVRILRFFS